jgi:LPXTG-site transpeptidase (sortase) family protein
MGKRLPSSILFTYLRYGGFTATFIITGLGLLGVLQWLATTQNPHVEIPATVVEVSTETPDETYIADICDRYTVAADHPRVLEIPSLGIRSCVQRVGIDQFGAIAVPTNVHLSGWYTGSSLPGESGVSIIDGHVRGRYRDGVFVRLHELSAGEMVRVQRGSGEYVDFTVKDVARYSVADANEALFAKIEDAESQLTLITCGGQYNEGDGTYSERIIVRAVRVAFDQVPE